jgi:DNA invertase Pin-like site-specific DNA recombinase
MKSDAEQEQRLRERCERDGKQLVRIERELDVSGGTALSKRHGLRRAVESIEAGEADEIMAVYFDRLYRSLKVQAEVSERVEAKGGKVIALDFGEIRNGTASEWVSASVLGMLAEYQRRSTKERTDGLRASKVAEGKMIWPKPPLGILLNDDRTMRIDESLRAVIRDAFELRAEGASKQAVRDLLARHGQLRTIRGVDAMLGQALYMGELRFGKLVNPRPFGDVEPIVDRLTWDKVQAMRTTSGRAAKSELLLARQGVLRCDGCGCKMVAGGAWTSWTNSDGQAKRTRYAFYKCPGAIDCPAPSSISAPNVEAFVVELVKATLSDAEERESAVREAMSARAGADAAARDYERGSRRLLLADIDDNEAARLLSELRAERDEREHEARRLERDSALAVSVNAAHDWDVLTLDERRGLVRATVASVRVRRGRASVAERCVAETFAQQSARRTA